MGERITLKGRTTNTLESESKRRKIFLAQLLFYVDDEDHKLFDFLAEIKSSQNIIHGCGVRFVSIKSFTTHLLFKYGC